MAPSEVKNLDPKALKLLMKIKKNKVLEKLKKNVGRLVVTDKNTPIKALCKMLFSNC